MATAALSPSYQDLRDRAVLLYGMTWNQNQPAIHRLSISRSPAEATPGISGKVSEVAAVYVQ